MSVIVLGIIVLLAVVYASDAFRFTSHSQLVRSSRLFGNGKPVEVSFEPSGKKVVAEQGDKLADVAKKAGVKVPYSCKQGRCTSCEVRVNGRVSAKLCQGYAIPTGPTKKLSVQVINTAPLKR